MLEGGRFHLGSSKGPALSPGKQREPLERYAPRLGKLVVKDLDVSEP